MPLTSTNNAMRPPGGSNFGGAFAKDAFASYVFPKPGERKYERKEHIAMTHGDPMAMSMSAMSFHLVTEAQRPSRLRKAFDHHVKMNGPDRKENVREAALRRSQSSPDVRSQTAPEPVSPSSRPGSSCGSPFSPNSTLGARGMNASISSMDSQRSGRSAMSNDVEDGHPESASWKLADSSMNTRWNPHPSTLRGKMKLSKAAASIYGADPQKDVTHDCPFFEADKHRFARVKSQPESRLATSQRSMRWTSEEHWNDEANHPALKINHVTHAGPRRLTAQKSELMKLDS